MPIIDGNSQTVQTHLGIIQGVIQRMASNGSSCKSWCITIVSAILVLVADKNNSRYALLALIPTILFLVLDAYYLSLEKMFRYSYNDFVNKLHTGKLSSDDLYAISPKGNLFKTTIMSVGSFSIWPFYSTLILMVVLAMKYVIDC